MQAAPWRNPCRLASLAPMFNAFAVSDNALQHNSATTVSGYPYVGGSKFAQLFLQIQNPESGCRRVRSSTILANHHIDSEGKADQSLPREIFLRNDRRIHCSSQVSLFPTKTSVFDRAARHRDHDPSRATRVPASLLRD
jgi:hypothetical protein